MSSFFHAFKIISGNIQVICITWSAPDLYLHPLPDRNPRATRQDLNPILIKSLTLFLIDMLFLSWTILQDAIHCQGALLEECHNPQLLKTDTLHKRAIDYLIGYNLILTKHTFYTFVVVQGLWKRPIGQTPQWNIFKLSVFLKENLWCCGHIVRRPAPILHPLIKLDISQIDVDFFQISVW